QSPHLMLAIECSKGTYIRSLAYDLGEQLDYGAHLAALVRTRSGPFSLAESITLEQLADAVEAGNAAAHLHPVDSALQQYPALQLDDTATEHVLHGNAFHFQGYSGQTPAELARVYDAAGQLLAIAEWDAQKGL